MKVPVNGYMHRHGHLCPELIPMVAGAYARRLCHAARPAQGYRVSLTRPDARSTPAWITGQAINSEGGFRRWAWPADPAQAA